MGATGNGGTFDEIDHLTIRREQGMEMDTQAAARRVGNRCLTCWCAPHCCEEAGF